MTDTTVMFVGRNGFGRKGNPVHGAPDILQQVQMLALADHVSHATIGEAISRGGNSNRIQKILMSMVNPGLKSALKSMPKRRRSSPSR